MSADRHDLEGPRSQPSRAAVPAVPPRGDPFDRPGPRRRADGWASLSAPFPPAPRERSIVLRGMSHERAARRRDGPTTPDPRGPSPSSVARGRAVQVRPAHRRPLGRPRTRQPRGGRDDHPHSAAAPAQQCGRAQRRPGRDVVRRRRDRLRDGRRPAGRGTTARRGARGHRHRRPGRHRVRRGPAVQGQAQGVRDDHVVEDRHAQRGAHPPSVRRRHRRRPLRVGHRRRHVRAQGAKPTIRKIVEHPRRYYVNVHNEDYPAGAIQGVLHR